MEIKICEKKQDCGHLLIERLVKELGGLGNENGLRKIKGGEEFKELSRKIKSLSQIVAEFEKEVLSFFDKEGYYLCIDPMQICWGRRKYLVCLKMLEEKRNSLKNSKSKSEVEK